MPFTPHEFRKVMGRFATGITVVTMVNPAGDYHGITVNSFTSVSLDPPLVLICLDKRSEAYRILPEVGAYCVNFLSADLEYLSNRFAGREPENKQPFHGIPFTTGTTGAPIFKVGLGYAECKVVQTVEAGDHTIFMAEVLDIEANDDGDQNPLLYYKSQYRFIKE